jgi:hypothetical protein
MRIPNLIVTPRGSGPPLLQDIAAETLARDLRDLRLAQR